jgi:hypothetical protein
MNDTAVWILVIAGVVVIAALIAWAVNRNLQSRRLKQRFGPEYERTLERTGDRRRAESVLGDRVSRRDEFELRALSPAARETYLRRWEQVQAEFVDQPGAAVRHAQSLLDEVMGERGYPIGEEFDERVDLISVDHPDVVEHYRLAHRLHSESAESGDTASSTEERRQALVHYRALFDDLLDTAEADRGSAGPDVADVPVEPTLDREGRGR